MRVVCDGNVFVSALTLPGGRADGAAQRILDGRDTLVISPAVILPADEPDNRIRECASAGGADRVVTGDKAMLALRSFRGMPIISPGEHVQ